MDILGFMESMGTNNIPLIAAFFIGLMTAISPCPLATNITAIAYVSKKIGNSRHTILVGLAYTLGRMLTYVTIAALIVWAGMGMQDISLTLQSSGNLLLGPILLIIGILMLGLINFPTKGSSRLDSLKESLSERGILGGFLLGALFALAFCPFSAVLFFGMLIPLALAAGDPIFIPSIFAFATGLPVIILSVILAYSVSKVGGVMNKIKIFELWMRRVVATIFILIGVYMTLTAYFI
jgi:cytochrome c-type biogenesis protein